MKVLFNQLFDYNYYCNKKLIEQAESLKQVPANCIKYFSHILNAHHRWNSNLLANKPRYDAWQLHDVKDWADIHYENQRATFEVITNADDFNKRIEYETAEGRVFAHDLKDILFHIINHSTHHRGQYLAEIRQNGIEPEKLDYILYKR
ncbi:MAG: damage-inducible protein DinB [Croceitalea sp.]|nr:damage-inducible protein DinB [Croceitalea sp.]NNC35676.1 damage-inducible protein DinB [Croceitalea sp.]NNL07973.1 damage-inducible protein DinB [Croceitalea sp.]